MKQIIGAFLVLAILSCNKTKDEETRLHNMEVVQDILLDSTVSDNPRESPVADERGAPPAKPSPVAADWTKKIIRTAELKIELEDYAAFNTAVHRLLPDYGAYIASEQQLETDIEISNQLSVKVPVDRFEDLVNRLTSDKRNRLLQKEISTSDVTAEYVDTRSRVETKKQVRARYYELLRQARKMDEVLEVQAEINSVTEEIEAAEGRMRYLGHQSAYSTIHLRYFQPMNAAGGRTTPGFITRFFGAVKEGAGLVGNLVLVAAYLWPLLLAAALAWLIFRKRLTIKSKAGG